MQRPYTMSDGSWIATQARLTLALTIAVGVPVIAALSGSYFLAHDAITTQDTQTQQSKMEEVRTQSKLLAANVWDEIDGIRVRATSYYEGGSKAVLSPRILTYSTLGGTEKALRIENFKKNPAWRNSTPARQLETELTQAVQQLSLKEIQETGYDLVTLGNRLGVAMKTQGTTVLFVTIAPSEVFSTFGRWVNRREGGNLRGYLINSDGKVIIHSDRAYSGADFKTGELYKNGLTPLFRGERLNGVSTFVSADLRNVMTSYQRLGTLSFAVVVERVVRANPNSISQGFLPSFGQVFSLLGILLVVSLISIFTIRSTISRELEANARPRIDTAELEMILAHQLKRQLKQDQLEENFDLEEPGKTSPKFTPPAIPRA